MNPIDSNRTLPAQLTAESLRPWRTIWEDLTPADHNPVLLFLNCLSKVGHKSIQEFQRNYYHVYSRVYRFASFVGRTDESSGPPLVWYRRPNLSTMRRVSAVPRFGGQRAVACALPLGSRRRDSPKNYLSVRCASKSGHWTRPRCSQAYATRVNANSVTVSSTLPILILF